MKKMHLSAIAAALLLVVAPAFAGGNSNNSDTINNFGDTNNTTYNQPSAYGGTAYGGTGLGVGVGIGGQGGDGGSAVSISHGGTGGAGGSAAIVGSGNSNTDLDVRNTNTNLNNNSAKADVTNINGQGQEQGQLQGQHQGQGQSQSADNAGNAQSTNITFNAPKTYRPPVNSAFAPTVFPTAPCMGSSSIGGTGTLFSISGGTSWESKECMILETARNFEQAGAASDAMYVRCQGKYAAVAPTCVALREGKVVIGASSKAYSATAATDAEDASSHPVSNTFPYNELQQFDAVQLY